MYASMPSTTMRYLPRPRTLTSMLARSFCKAAVLLMPIVVIACGREPRPQNGTHGGNGGAGTSAGASASAHVRSCPTDASARAGGDTPDAGLPVIARRDGIVSVDPEPACAERTGTGNVAADAAVPHAGAPPAKPTSYAAPEGPAIERELQDWKAFIAGTDRDEQRDAMIVLLHQDFADYDGLERKLERVCGPHKIVLRPACHSRRSIEDARRVLDARDWHPQAKSTPMAWTFDTTFSGFSVSVDSSAPEVAKALEQRLGKLVRTRLENLRPHPNQIRAERSGHMQPSKPIPPDE